MNKSKNNLTLRTLATAFGLVAASSVFAVNAFDPGSNLLTLEAVRMNGSTYRNVAATVNSYTLVGVAGGIAGADTFDPATNTLLLGSVAFQGTVYTNVTVKINSYTLHSTAGAATPGTLGAPNYTGEIGSYLATLNNYRTQCGIPALVQNTVLDSVAHSVGVGLGVNDGIPSILATSAGYAVPGTAGGLRGDYRTASANTNLVGLYQLQTAMMDPGALLNMLRPYTDIGMMYELQLVGGYSRVEYLMFGNPVTRNLPAPVTFPCSNTTNVPPYGTTFVGGVYYAAMAPTGLSSDYIERINGSQGTPIAVFANPGQSLVLTGASVTLRGGLGVPVTMRSSDRAIYPYEGFVWPRQNLLPNATYDVVINGTVDGVAFEKRFAFSTGDAIPLRLP